MEKKLKEIMRELSNEAQWVGEDGEATCVARTEKAAWRKFATLMQQDVGDFESKEIQSNHEIGLAYLFLFTPEESKEHDDAEWYVSTKKVSPYEVWLLSPK